MRALAALSSSATPFDPVTLPMREVIADRGFDGVRSRKRRIVAGQLAGDPIEVGLRLLLRLVERENRPAIGFNGVVSGAKRLVMLPPVVIAKPRSRSRRRRKSAGSRQSVRTTVSPNEARAELHISSEPTG